MDGPIDTAAKDFKPLTDEEINNFFDDIDRNNNGTIEFSELEAKLHEVHQELAPEPLAHHLHHPSRRGRDVEKADGKGHKGDGLHAFLCSLMPNSGDTIARDEFMEKVKSWNVPSQKQTDSTSQDKDDAAEEKGLPMRRRIRAYVAVHGSTYAFVALVVALQLAFGLWQMISYLQRPTYRAALGWGVILAKTCAGVLYPTLFFMLLSMSRHFATFMRRSYTVSRFANWDLTQSFHIKMACAGLFFATLHAIGHLAGDMLYSTRPSREQQLEDLLGPDAVPMSYVDWVRALPGWTGIVALSSFWIISLLSVPYVRKRSYELFQLGHLLMFPMIAMLVAHGTAQYLYHPMLGYWLAFPALLVVGERSWRLIRGFMHIPAKLRVLDDETAELTCKHPSGKDWPYSAGQYVLLQVPALSFFQWHPFTISSCRGPILQLHIKFDGDWTRKLRDLGQDSDKRQVPIKVGIDGPFGAPAQRFYDYDYSIIVGGGIGITPFSAILTDIEESQLDPDTNPWDERRGSRSLSRPGSRSVSRAVSRAGSRRTSRSRSHSRRASLGDLTATDDEATKKEKEGERSGSSEEETETEKFPPCKRRVDFHWTVREKNNLLWFADLLNRASDGAKPLQRSGDLELNINTHITAKRKNISTHIFRYLLDSYRTPDSPYSALTGLKAPSHFGRPDFDAILETHYEEIIAAAERTGEGLRDDTDSEIAGERRVGVFYCGPAVVGEILSDKCHMLTARARHEGRRVRYDFLIEVFG
ncbi:hypothetical protein MBLNU230_g7034t1 [Neophaeotheca triangularis]